jgi:uncharacterized YccA/Bax inhibitor family protein
MSLLKSGNPTLSENRFKETILDNMIDRTNTMTIRGTLNKFGMLFLLMMTTAFYAWKEFQGGGDVKTLWMIGAFGCIILSFALYFKPIWAPWLAPVHTLLEGLFVGAISAYFNYAFSEKAPYIIIQAVGLTMGTCIAMYLSYSFRIIKATQKFKAIVMTATMGIAFFYLIAFGLSFLDIRIPFLHEGSVIGIGFSLLVVGLAALNLILDFDMIETGSEMGAPKYMEWYGAFGLIVTVVWLYLEILRLLSKLNSRD